MSESLEKKLDEAVRELAAVRAELGEIGEELFALALREVAAKRALPASWDALVSEEGHHATLTKLHDDAKAPPSPRGES